ncbi:hypothetical protein BJX65DRAFT_264933 [Aspergillus insuetus]
MNPVYENALCCLCCESIHVYRIRTPEEAEEEIHGDYVSAMKDDLGLCSTEKTGCFYVVRSTLFMRRGVDEPGEASNGYYFFDLFDLNKGEFPTVGQRLPMIPDHKEKKDQIGIVGDGLEHIGAQGCKSRAGSSGYCFSKEEMKAAQTVQSLVLKPTDWEPAPDDHEIERSSNYYLTGICNGMLGREAPTPALPVRHGKLAIEPKCPFLETRWDSSDGIPFHPWCLGMFLQQCRFRLDYLPINELVWMFLNPPHEAIEWLMMKFFHSEEKSMRGEGRRITKNPFSVSELRPLLERATATGLSFSVDDTPFKIRRDTTRDCFSKLPQELRLSLLENLRPGDIASLRLASRSFDYIPIFFWYRLLCRDMPWIWEVWSDEPPYFWATVTYDDIRQNEKEGYEPKPGSKERVVLSHSIDVDKHLVEWTLPNPPLDKTDWYMLYRDIRRLYRRSEVLQNRERIWQTQDRILQTMGLVPAKHY